MDDFLMEHAGSKAAQTMIAEQREEAALYRRFKNFYSYGFYIGRRM
jgi:hypothetical protein